ncbi:MAG: LuxR C-terminal-related transcriptional regulator [Chloroflexi bacterium]|nr:LuxR C-terminal-related transcriptional regulator [Chloroflexota bacterium]
MALKHGNTQPLLIPLSHDGSARVARRITVHLAILDSQLERSVLGLLGRNARFSVVTGSIGYAAESDVRIVDCVPHPDQQRELNEQRPPKLLFLGEIATELALMEAAKAGAWAFVAESEDDEVLEQTISDLVMSKGSPLLRKLASNETGSKAILADLAKRRERRTPNSSTSNPLNPRDVKILEHIARGESSKDIGEAMKLSEQTIKNYVVRILDRTHTHNRAHAAALAAQRGWLSPLDAF